MRPHGEGPRRGPSTYFVHASDSVDSIAGGREACGHTYPKKFPKEF